MHAPRGFRRWRCHWFECPACRHRSYRAFSNVVTMRERPYMAWRFWCERCGAYSKPADPMLPVYAAAVALLFVGPVSFVFVHRAMLAGLRFEWLVLIFAAFWIAQPLVILALTRSMYRYVPSA